MTVNDHLYCVYGLRRSGNHAVISWVLDNTPGRPQVHLNDVHVLGPSPYHAFVHMQIRGIDRYTCNRKRFRLNRHVLTRIAGPLLPVRRRMHIDTGILAKSGVLDVEAIRKVRKRVLVVSYEDIDLENPRLHKFLSAPDEYVGPSKRLTQFIILRDPYNVFASLLQRGYMTPTSLGFYSRIWKQHARYFQAGQDATGRPLVPVNYNSWASDRNYRIDTAAKLGFETDGSPYMRVPRFGGGSSFEGKVDSAEKLSTSDRWAAFVDDADYRSMFDDDIRETAKDLFGMEAPF